MRYLTYFFFVNFLRKIPPQSNLSLLISASVQPFFLVQVGKKGKHGSGHGMGVVRVMEWG